MAAPPRNPAPLITNTYVLQRDGVTIELTSGNYDERTIRNAILAAHPASGIELWRLGPTPGGLTWLVG